MALAKPKRKKPHDPAAAAASDAATPRPNGVRSAPKAAATKPAASAGKERAIRSSPTKGSAKHDAGAKKKHRRKGDKDGESPPPKKKRKHKPETVGSARASSTGTDEDSSDDDAGCYARGTRSQLPAVGDEIAVKCPPVPPYPEGWYTGVVVDVVVHGSAALAASNIKIKVGPQSRDKGKNFTIHVEWDGGGEETLSNPEWRMKGDAPDKQGRVSHRDAKLRPYFKYWVNRLNSMADCEKELSRSRAGKALRVDPGQRIEWIQCSNPSCGKWRPLPPYLKSSAILESCNSHWFCVLNSWDEAMASCGAPQETGYMPPE